jgi:glycoprotein endo-alpha-1,2-mannosidase
MRRLLPSLILALLLPATAQAGVRVSAFYYPWYGTSAKDGAFQHWAQRGHAPPNDIASAYYPSRGLYSSSDALVTGQQMDDMRAAGIDEVAVSWWGKGSPEDSRLPEVAAAARADGLNLAVHLEPYTGRTVESTVADVKYLRTFGVRTFYLYRPLDLPVAEWAAAKTALHEGGTTVFAQTALVGSAAAGGFDGVYTYDIVIYGGGKFGRLCTQARAVKLLCAPSVGPGYDARRGSGDPVVKLRKNGATYDSMWKMAIAAGADRVTITSYNEWHEGTQIEAASSTPKRRGQFRYLTYDGAWGLHGTASEGSYLARTRYWSDVFRSTSPAQLKTKAS